MSNQLKKNPSPIIYNGFEGIDRSSAHTAGLTATDIQNFCIRDDGSLEKRCGYRPLADAEGRIRAFWSGVLHGKFYIYLLSDDVVFSLDLATEKLTVLGTISTHEGNACFFSYKSILYMMDGRNLYEIIDGVLRLAIGYVPQIGKDWPDALIGEPYEAKNLLTRHVRISYVIDEIPTIFLCVGEEIESVEAVFINGELASSDRYFIDNKLNTINILEPKTGDRATVYLTLKNGADDKLTKEILSSTNTVLFGSAEENRIFFWNSYNSNTMFCSDYATKDRVAEAQTIYPTSSSLYIPKGFEFTVGEGRYNIRAAIRHYDRLLIFTEGDTWMSPTSVTGQEESPAIQINTSIGCTSPDGITQIGNDPVTVGQYGIWRWIGDTDQINACSAVNISEKINSMLSHEDWSNMGIYYHRRTDELWLNLKKTGDVLICKISKKQWYRYTGIHAERFFDAEGKVGFTRDGMIYIFDPSMLYDQDSIYSYREICAEYTGDIFDFDTDQKKNLSQVVFRGDLEGGTLELRVCGDGIEDASCTLYDPQKTQHSVIRKRLHSGRFRYASLHMKASGKCRQVIHSLALYAR